MRTQSTDTSPEAEKVQIDLLRKASQARRFGLVRSLTHAILQWARGARGHLRPLATELELVELHYGMAVADRIRGAGNTKLEAVNSPDILAAAAPVIDAFEVLGIPYCIGGSVASSIQGIPRATLDIDLVADIRLPQVSGLVQLLQGSYFIDEGMIVDALQHYASFNLIHFATMLKLDIYVLKPRPYDQEAFRRVRSASLDQADASRSFRIESAEDVILHKLEWYKMGGEVSDRQWTDVMGVLKVQGKPVDLAYMRLWADRLGISELLGRALDNSGILE